MTRLGSLNLNLSLSLSLSLSSSPKWKNLENHLKTPVEKGKTDQKLTKRLELTKIHPKTKRRICEKTNDTLRIERNDTMRYGTNAEQSNTNG